jgi:fibronectin type 3 domain-containing protein
VIRSQAPMRVPRPNWYVRLGGRGGSNGSQRFGHLLLFLMVLLAAPTQSGCASSSGVDVQPPKQPISYTVTLDWVASTSPVMGYNVYRGTASGGPYMLLNSSLVTATQYEDSMVLSGQTYYYVVTAVDSSNVESTYSNQASAKIPTP